MKLDKNQLQALSEKYDKEYPWWIEVENNIGSKIRQVEPCI
jgi:hypothetical protein